MNKTCTRDFSGVASSASRDRGPFGRSGPGAGSPATPSCSPRLREPGAGRRPRRTGRRAPACDEEDEEAGAGRRPRPVETARGRQRRCTRSPWPAGAMRAPVRPGGLLARTTVVAASTPPRTEAVMREKRADPRGDPPGSTNGPAAHGGARPEAGRAAGGRAGPCAAGPSPGHGAIRRSGRRREQGTAAGDRRPRRGGWCGRPPDRTTGTRATGPRSTRPGPGPSGRTSARPAARPW